MLKFTWEDIKEAIRHIEHTTGAWDFESKLGRALCVYAWLNTDTEDAISDVLSTLAYALMDLRPGLFGIGSDEYDEGARRALRRRAAGRRLIEMRARRMEKRIAEQTGNSAPETDSNAAQGVVTSRRRRLVAA